MSFALEFRKKLTVGKSQTTPASSTSRHPSTARRSKTTPDKSLTNARRVAGALLIAGLILAVFNSAALVRYSRGLSDKICGPKFISVSETWHGLMERAQTTNLADHIRTMVTTARQSNWGDIVRQIGLDEKSAVGERAEEKKPVDGVVTSIPGRYGDQPSKPFRRTSVDQSS